MTFILGGGSECRVVLVEDDSKLVIVPDGVPRWVTCDRSGDRATEGIAFPLIVVVTVLVACRIEIVSACTDGLDWYASP